MDTIKSENCNRATMKRDNRRRLVLLQTLSTRDFDELAQAFPQWDLRFRQLGRGPFSTSGSVQKLIHCRGELVGLLANGPPWYRRAVELQRVKHLAN
jgi:hypothetical protein